MSCYFCTECFTVAQCRWPCDPPPTHTHTHTHTHTRAHACTRTRLYHHTVNNIQLHVKGSADFIVCSVKRDVDVPVRRVEAGRRLLLPVLVHTRPTTGRCSDSAHTESGDAPSVLACALT